MSDNAWIAWGVCVVVAWFWRRAMADCERRIIELEKKVKSLESGAENLLQSQSTTRAELRETAEGLKEHDEFLRWARRRVKTRAAP